MSKQKSAKNKIIISGITGKMGTVLCDLIQDYPEFVCCAGIKGSTVHSNTNITVPIISQRDLCNTSYDVLIDFSHASLTKSMLKYGSFENKRLVIGTTNLDEDTWSCIRCISHHTPVLYDENFSIGINQMTILIQNIIPCIMQNWDIDLVDKHHNQKKDSPSGTAKKILNILHREYQKSQKCYNADKRNINVLSIRSGGIIGEHTLSLTHQDELIEISHKAINRLAFARGALESAKFLLEKKSGLYSVQSLLK